MKSDKRNNSVTTALKAAFPVTVPVMTGFLFLGFSYGVYMNVSGFSFIYPMIMAMVIFGGSLEFVAVTMLMSTFAPVQTFIVAFIIQARHIFYGLSMLEKYKGMGIKKLFLIFGLCDETFSINCSAEVPENVDKGKFYLFVTILNQIYWITGATTGGLVGSLIPISTDGLEFVMTAMFVVIFLDQWLKEKKHISSLIGVIASVVCLFVFGKDNFLIPTMLCILLALTVLRRSLEKEAKS